MYNFHIHINKKKYSYFIILIQSYVRRFLCKNRFKYFLIMPIDIKNKIINYIHNDLKNIKYNIQLSNYLIKKFDNYFEPSIIFETQEKYVNYCLMYKKINSFNDLENALKILRLNVKYYKLLEYNKKYNKLLYLYDKYSIIYPDPYYLNISVKMSLKEVIYTLYELVSFKLLEIDYFRNYKLLNTIENIYHP